MRGVERAEAFSAQPRGRTIGPQEAPPPMTLDGAAVDWATLQPRLAEASGAAIVEEIALERLLEAEVSRRNLTVGQAAIERERAVLLETVSEQAEGNTEQLVSQLRARRGLGPVRYASLLRRNAMLRALVADRIEVRPDQVELAWRVQHGERVRLRIIVVPSERQAQQVRVEVGAADPTQAEARFIALAQQHSTDSSAARGGLVEPFSTADPAYEAAIRAAADLLQPGQLGPVVAIRNGFAVPYMVERIAPDGVSLGAANAALTAQLRVRQERLLMDELATQLLAEARITTFDDALSWSRDAAAAGSR